MTASSIAYALLLAVGVFRTRHTARCYALHTPSASRGFWTQHLKNEYDKGTSTQLLLFMNLNQVTVPSIDVEKSIEFYTQLGLHLIVKSIPRYARFECPEGEATFSIHQVEKLPQGTGTIVYFEIDKLDEYVQTLIDDKGFTFDLLPKDQPWLWREAHLKDPDGNQIILFHAGENRKNPPWRVKG